MGGMNQEQSPEYQCCSLKLKGAELRKFWRAKVSQFDNHYQKEFGREQQQSKNQEEMPEYEKQLYRYIIAYQERQERAYEVGGRGLGIREWAMNT